MVNFEYQMHYVDDGEMKTLLRLKYIDGLTNFQIAHKMNEKGNKKYTEDSVRMQIKRFLEKNQYLFGHVRFKRDKMLIGNKVAVQKWTSPQLQSIFRILYYMSCVCRVDESQLFYFIKKE